MHFLVELGEILLVVNSYGFPFLGDCSVSELYSLLIGSEAMAVPESIE